MGEKAKVVIKFHTDSRYILRFFVLGSKFLKVLSRLHNAYVETEMIHQGGLIFFLNEKSLFNFFKFAEEVSQKIKKKDLENMKDRSKQRFILEIIEYPDNLDVKKYVKWARKIALRATGWVKIQKAQENPHPKFVVMFKRGKFIDSINFIKWN